MEHVPSKLALPTVALYRHQIEGRGVGKEGAVDFRAAAG